MKYRVWAFCGGGEFEQTFDTLSEAQACFMSSFCPFPVSACGISVVPDLLTREQSGQLASHEDGQSHDGKQQHDSGLLSPRGDCR